MLNASGMKEIKSVCQHYEKGCREFLPGWQSQSSRSPRIRIRKQIKLNPAETGETFRVGVLRMVIELTKDGQE
jgi:hypothetical protein